MTEEERRKLDETYEMCRRFNDFMFGEEYKGKPMRAEQLDRLLTGYATGKMTIRAALWLAGSIVAIGGAMSVIKGWGWFK